MENKNDPVEIAISQTLDNLPPSYLIFGKKKDHSPLEEFWMNKLESIESQYDKHIVKIKRSLLDNRANRRRIIKKDEQITKLKTVLEEKTDKVEKLSTEQTKLKHELSLKSYKTRKLEENLALKEELRHKILKSLENERFERMKRGKELIELKHQLIKLERDKKILCNDISLKDGERNRTEDQNAQLAQNKYNMIKNLTEIDQERRIQQELNLKLVEDVGNLLEGCKTKQYTLLKQRKDIDLMLANMKQKRKEQEETLRKLGIQGKRLQDADHDKKLSKEALEHVERQVMHWKEEFQIKALDNQTASLEIKDLRRENSILRCQLAALKESQTRNEHQIKSLEVEKRRTETELQKAKEQSRSVHLVMCRNEILKQKRANKILKEHPHIKQALDARGHGGRVTKRRSGATPTGSGSSLNQTRDNLKEIQSYKKKIWELERQNKELELQLNEMRGKQNRLQFQIKKYDGMEKEILWTEKAMVKLEGDRNRLEDLMKSMALNVPKKIPFEKLVTDPSIIDRLGNYQVLQKRLLAQTEKVETLKRSAAKVMEYRKLLSEDREADKRMREVPKWKLSHWKEKGSSEDTLADVDQQLLDQEGIQQHHQIGQGGMPPLTTDRKYYKDYMGYLDNEIPQLKQKIAVLERKQHYIQQQQLDAEQRAQSLELGRGGHRFDEDKEFRGHHGEDEDEEDDLDDLGGGGDSDEEGFMPVSIDEPSSARK